MSDDEKLNESPINETSNFRGLSANKERSFDFNKNVNKPFQKFSNPAQNNKFINVKRNSTARGK